MELINYDEDPAADDPVAWSFGTLKNYFKLGPLKTYKVGGAVNWGQAEDKLLSQLVKSSNPAKVALMIDWWHRHAPPETIASFKSFYKQRFTVAYQVQKQEGFKWD